MRIAIPITLVLLVGCSDDAPNDVIDGAVDDGQGPNVDGRHLADPCAFPPRSTPSDGQYILGDNYQPRPVGDEYPLEYGTQEGFMFVVRLGIEMAGFQPGDQDTYGHPTNPATRLGVYFDDTNVPLTGGNGCGATFGYKEIAPGKFEREYPYQIIFATCWRSDNLIGKRLRVEADVIDALGNFVSLTKVITAAAPTGDYTIDMNSPGCPPQ